MEVQPSYFPGVLKFGFVPCSLLRGMNAPEAVLLLLSASAGKLQSSLWPISARVPVGHLIKEVAVRFVHVYKVTDRSFLNP